MIEIFKTNISDAAAADKISFELSRILPNAAINFDLEDSDRILRIVSNEPVVNQTINFLLTNGHYCEVLID